MKTRIKTYLKLLPLLSFLLAIASLAFLTRIPMASADLLANQEGLTTDIGSAFGAASGEPRDIRVIVAQIINVFLGLLGILFIALIVLAGYKWMMAQGDMNKVDEAKEQLRTSVIGLAIILSAWGVTNFVTCAVLKAADQNLIWCPT